MSKRIERDPRHPCHERIVGCASDLRSGQPLFRQRIPGRGPLRPISRCSSHHTCHSAVVHQWQQHRLGPGGRSRFRNREDAGAMGKTGWRSDSRRPVRNAWRSRPPLCRTRRSYGYPRIPGPVERPLSVSAINSIDFGGSRPPQEVAGSDALSKSPTSPTSERWQTSKSGITERQIANLIAIAFLDQGADGWGFPPTVAFGPNSAKPHHDPGDRKALAGR